jgi:hypothetical protein
MTVNFTRNSAPTAQNRADDVAAEMARANHAALRAGLAALGWTADSPATLGDEAEQIAREERADCS